MPAKPILPCVRGALATMLQARKSLGWATPLLPPKATSLVRRVPAGLRWSRSPTDSPLLPTNFPRAHTGRGGEEPCCHSHAPRRCRPCGRTEPCPMQTFSDVCDRRGRDGRFIGRSYRRPSTFVDHTRSRPPGPSARRPRRTARCRDLATAVDRGLCSARRRSGVRLKPGPPVRRTIGLGGYHPAFPDGRRCQVSLSLDRDGSDRLRVP